MDDSKLTAPFIRALKPSDKRIEFSDHIIRGMKLRVTPNGHKTFVYRYRFGKKVKRYTIGSFPTIGLADARSKAKDLARQISDGIDPAYEKRVKKNARVPLTVSELAQKYKDRHLPKLKASTRNDYIRRIDHEIIPKLGKYFAKEVTKSQVIDLLEDIAVKRNAPTHSNRVRAILSSMYGFGIEREYVDYNPVSGIKPLGKEQSRSRAYSEKEIKKLWKSFELQAEPVQSVFKILLLCGQRLGETSHMQWAHIKGGIWSIPAEETKADRSHYLPLSQRAIDIIEKLRPLTGESDYVFESPIAKNKPISYLQKAAGRIRESTGIKDFRIHDLRRTAATNMAELGTERTVLGKVLNHKGLSGDHLVTAVYDRYDYMDEKRLALERWSQKLTDILYSKRKSAKIYTIGSR